ncbi:MAG: tetratricopeptide repeat protein [Chitinophagaceae bacterium]
MNKVAKIISFSLSFLIFIIGCTNNDKQVSAYDDILRRPPFAPLTDSIDRFPKNDELWFRRAVLLNSSNQPDPALADFKKAWALRKEEKYAFAISTLLLEKNPDAALLFLDTAITALPGSFLLQLSLARGYAAAGKPADALAVCDKILSANPQQVDVLKLKADLLDKEGKTNDATAVLESAYHTTPFDVELNYILTLRYAQAKNPRVLVICDSLIRADSIGEHAEPYYYKGIYYSNLGDNSKALALFDEAVKHDYNFLEGYIEKGSLLFDMKRYNDALAVFNLALTISPQYADAYYWIAKCQEATGKKAEAKANYERAYSLDNSLTEAREGAQRVNN